MITSILTYIYREKIPFIFAIIITITYFHYFIQPTNVEIELSTNENSYFNIYWAKDDKFFSEKNSAYKATWVSKNNYKLKIPNISDFSRLRIDPCGGECEVTIKSIVFKHRLFEPLILSSQDDFNALKPIKSIADVSFGESGLDILTDGEDPQLIFYLPELKSSISIFRIIAECFGVFIFIFSISIFTLKKETDFVYSVPFFTAVLVSVLIMASITEKNTHPDEYVHISAAEYYIDHWLPPEVDSPDIKDTYSVYGVSRLNSPEIYYLLAGKFQAILSPLNLPNYLSFRIFNVGLLFALTMLLAHRSHKALALCLLISPQIWYVFSYCNTDAFAIFLSVIVAYQLIYEKSLFNNYIKNKEPKIFLPSAIILGFLLGILLLNKQYYYFFIVFALGYVVCREYWEISCRKTFLLRLCTIALIGLAIFGLRKGLDYTINGFDRSEKLLQLRNETALPIFLNSEQHLYLYMKDKGVSLKQIVTDDRWFEKTFFSSFGQYGYFTASGSFTYFNLVRYTALAMFLFLGVSALLSKDKKIIFLFFWALFCGSALISASIYHSWTADFQNQGRYLLTIALMFGVFFVHIKEKLNRKIFTLLLSVMFLLSLYSFIYTGIFNLPKV